MVKFVRRIDPEINLTPMMDIVFIMLIFFIVSATFLKETGLDINRPEGAPPDVVNPDDVAILVQVDEAGRISLNGEPILESAVKPRVARLLSENPDRLVVIMPDFEATSGLAIRLYDKVLQIDRGANVAMAEPS